MLVPTVAFAAEQKKGKKKTETTKGSSSKKPQQPAVALPSVDDVMNAAEQAYVRYDFNEAMNILNDAARHYKGELPAAFDAERQHLEMASSFMDRIEKIVILDSIAVPRNDFFRAYKLPYSSGYLGDGEEMPMRVDGVDYVFTNEGDDFKMWAQPDSTGRYNIFESIRLTDGKWSRPVGAPAELAQNADAVFPFMMPDGVTLYFASNNDSTSLGGFDIYVAKRDPNTGAYLQPQNVGMPYNSPYDDYLLAIDELNGVGWWATDRNQLGDKITIYLFKVNELRSNYNAEETPDLADKARILNWRSTWESTDDYSELISEVMQIEPGRSPALKEIEFEFPVPGGKVYTTYSDFKNTAVRNMMKQYLSEKKLFEKKETELSALRREYSVSPSNTLKAKILQQERDLEGDRAMLRRHLSDLYKELR